MGIRQKLNQHPALVICAVVGVVVSVATLVIWSGDAAAPAGPEQFNTMKAFFSVDDGKSFFPDDAIKLPPFKTADGKVAYRAHVTRCGEDPPAVAYLERFSDVDKKRLEEALGRQSGPGGSPMMVMMNSGARAMVKKPLTGDRGWVQFSAQTAREYQRIIEARCPDGRAPTRVTPE